MCNKSFLLNINLFTCHQVILYGVLVCSYKENNELTECDNINTVSFFCQIIYVKQFHELKMNEVGVQSHRNNQSNVFISNSNKIGVNMKC